MSRKKTVQTTSHTRDLAQSWARERPDLVPEDYLVPIYCTRLNRITEILYDEQSQKKYGLSAAEIRVVLALRRTGPPFTLRHTDLFRSVLVTSGAITKQVKRLCDAGYVERTLDPGNNSTLLVRLTVKGIALADDALDGVAHWSSTNLTENSLTIEERHIFRIICEKFLSDLEQRFPQD